jgi:PAS domain S-box-containing protein
MKILYIEDGLNDIELVRAEIAKKAPHYSIDVVHTRRDAMNRLTQHQNYDLVITDMRLPDGDGLAILSHIRGRSLSLAVVLVTGVGDEETAVAVMKAGADDYIPKRGAYWKRFPEVLENALNHFSRQTRNRSPMHVLYVDDNDSDILTTQKHFAKTVPHILIDAVHSGAELLKQLSDTGSGFHYDILLIDYRLPDINGIDLIREIYQVRHIDIPTVLITGYGDEEAAMAALQLGVSDYVSKQTTYLNKLPLVLENAFYSFNLARKNAALLIAQERLTIIVENAPVGIFIIQDAQITFANPEAIGMFGFDDIQTFVGLPPAMLIVPEEREKVFHQIDRRIAGTHELIKFETRAQKQNGQIFDIAVRITTIHHQNKPASLIFIADISQEKSLQTQLFQAQKMEAMGILAGGIAHDFNNILSAILGYTEMAMMSTDPGTQIYKDMEEVLRSGHRAEELVRQILTFSRKSEMERHPLQLDTLLKEVFKMLRASLPSTIEIRQDFQISAQALPGMILANPTHIHQVIMNLCTNAKQAMLETGGLLEVRFEDVELDDEAASRISGLKSGPYLRLTVKDSGSGIDPAIRERIFEPYFTTKAVGEGTGLGLAVVHGIMTHHQGAVTVESEPGKGASFILYFPRLLDARKTELHTDQPVLTGNERVLIVDDEEPLVRMWTNLLTPLGYRVSGHIHTGEALEAFSRQPDAFDIVITDYTMPTMTGMALAGEIQKIRSGMPIILCTGLGNQLAPDLLKASGIGKVLRKPVGMPSMTAAIRELCAQ